MEKAPENQLTGYNSVGKVFRVYCAYCAQIEKVKWAKGLVGLAFSRFPVLGFRPFPPLKDVDAGLNTRT